jgi:lactoylglutathione lyase
MKHAHIGIKCLNLHKAEKFYSEYLGAKRIKTISSADTQIIFLEIDTVILELFKVESIEDQDGTVDHITFQVEDIHTEHAKLKAADIEILYEGIQDFHQWKILFFRGPSGEKIEFLQEA